MLIAQDTNMKTRSLKLGGVIGIEDLEEQVRAKGGRTPCGRTHEARSLL